MRAFLVLIFCLFPILANANNALGAIGGAIEKLIVIGLFLVLPFLIGMIFMISRMKSGKVGRNIGTYICFGLIVVIVGRQLIKSVSEISERLSRYGDGPLPKLLSKKREVYIMLGIVIFILLLISINVWNDISDRKRKSIIENDL
jgi:fumarate reductase subunit D